MKKVIDLAGSTGVILFILLHLLKAMLPIGAELYSALLTLSVILFLPLAVVDTVAFFERLRKKH